MITSLVRIVTGTSILMASAAAQQPVASTEPPLGRGACIGGAPQEMSAEETAKQLANPNTPLASLTLKNQWTHWNGDLPGSGDIDSQTFLFQPSFPFPINDTDSIFLRPAFPFLLDQPVVDSTGNVRTESGFGDMGLDLAFGRTSKQASSQLLALLPAFRSDPNRSRATHGPWALNCSTAESPRPGCWACLPTTSGMPPDPGRQA